MFAALALFVALFVALCACPSARPANDVLVSDALDALDSGLPDDVVLPDRPDVPPPRRTLSPSPLALADIVGIAAHPGDFPLGTSAAARNRRAFYYRKLHELGIHRMRRDFRWTDIEPAAGRFVWDNYDAFVDEAQAERIDVLALLCYGNPWASSMPGATDTYAPDDPATFARFARAVAAHYAGRIHEYEIWNEPNAGFRFWLPTAFGDPRAFGALVTLAARAVREADPSARAAYGGTVFLPQLVPGGVEFARQSLATNPDLAGALSAFAFHAYELYPPVNEPEASRNGEVPLTDKVALLAGMLERAGVDRDIPLWLTEVGWPVTMAVPPAAQARYLVRSVLLSALAGSARTFLFTLGDGPHPEAFIPEDAFGLVAYDPDTADATDPADKPSFVALRTLFRTLGTFRVTARAMPMGAPTDVWVLELHDSTRRGWAVWRVSDATDYAWLPPAGAVVDATEFSGAAVAPSAAGYRVSVDVVFVRER